MNTMSKLLQSAKRVLLLKLSNIALLVGNFAAVNSCTFFFHEEEIPEELKRSHLFLTHEE
ncbi:cyclic lactone autoinducer peptide [Bacillus xiapuensis]|uniref:cyclic lactone autoinducer peptide n=1 Tax=Bacillus xiapuensis TaxID=2014075 RepID=UPI000C2349AC|nr:cyclic lactone autoinducer peptide [Bacillus xiapuensis]